MSAPSTTTTGAAATLTEREWTNWSIIPNRMGSPYKMERRRAGATPGSLERFTVWVARGSDPRPHNHPWSFTSRVLSGGFLEWRYIPQVDEFGDTYYKTESFYRKAGDVYECPHGTIHMITDVMDGTTTHMMIDPLVAGPRDWNSFRPEKRSWDTERLVKVDSDSNFLEMFKLLNTPPV